MPILSNFQKYSHDLWNMVKLGKTSSQLTLDEIIGEKKVRAERLAKMSATQSLEARKTFLERLFVNGESIRTPDESYKSWPIFSLRDNILFVPHTYQTKDFVSRSKWDKEAEIELLDDILERFFEKMR